MTPSHAPAAAPRVSVIMATYNGSRFLRQSINSILAQTWRDFELIVVDDCSTDGTGDLLAEIGDPRVRVVRNRVHSGVVTSRNRGFAEARGAYVAMLDHDDLSRPTRLEKQVAYLDRNPGTVVVGTAAHVLDNGRLAPSKHPAETSPLLIRWLLNVANPLICSSVMLRAAAVKRLGVFMRDNYEFADDYDLYHRLKALGDIARLDEPLSIYRLHPGNTFRKHEDTMIANAVQVLAGAYADWFGDEAGPAAALVVRHLSATKPVPDAPTLDRLGRYFTHLNRAFVAAHPVDERTRKAIATQADELWLRVLRASACGFKACLGGQLLPSGKQLSFGKRLRLSVGRAASRGVMQGLARDLARRRARPSRPVPTSRLFGTVYEPLAVDPNQPPTMFVVVDTEAEFDWTGPFARNLTSVAAMDAIERGQALFDAYGLRPIYVVDFPISSQERSVQRLRRILERGACEIGAHLHPWTTPPFEEELSSRNSYPGNLSPELEERKLARLLQAIRESFGVTPLFYKAGRYGFGARTALALARHGIKVDLSVLAGADLRRRGGPDFRGFQAVPYRIRGHDILAVPMTRCHVGLVPAFGAALEAAKLPGSRLFPIRSVMSRLRIVDTVTLTPEGVTAAEQIRAIKAMLGRGIRLFVMHYHSPSLSPGHTPYVRTAADADAFVARMREVCQFFFGEIGGMPGYPRDLLSL